MPVRATTGRGRRRKGRAFELWVIKDLWESFIGKVPWKKNESPDDGFKAPPPFDGWHLEMKNQEALRVWMAVKQAEDAAIGQDWAVIMTKARRGAYVVISYEAWKRMVWKESQ